MRDASLGYLCAEAFIDPLKWSVADFYDVKTLVEIVKFECIINSNTVRVCKWGWLVVTSGWKGKGMFHVNPMCFHSNYIEQREVVKNQTRTHMSVLLNYHLHTVYIERERERDCLSIRLYLSSSNVWSMYHIEVGHARLSTAPLTIALLCSSAFRVPVPPVGTASH